MSVAAPGEAAPATLAGRYVLAERLGAGRHGAVHRAADVRSRQVVAVKFARCDDPQDPRAADRFDREARLLATACSPHIVRLLDHGREGDFCYLVLEHAGGGTLGARLRTGIAGDPWETAAVGRALAVALRTLHSHGIVHLDVNPANVLIAAAGSRRGPPDRLLVDGDRLLLGDLTIARRLDEPSIHDDRRYGTRLYRAPEQATPTAPAVAADIYAATAVLVSVITGRLPPASSRLSALLSALRPQWRALVATGMHDDPSVRYCDVESWYAALVDAINRDLSEAGHDAIA